MNAVIFFCKLLRVDQKQEIFFLQNYHLFSSILSEEDVNWGLINVQELHLAPEIPEMEIAGSREGILYLYASFCGFSWRQGTEPVEGCGLTQCSSLILILHVIQISGTWRNDISVKRTILIHGWFFLLFASTVWVWLGFFVDFFRMGKCCWLWMFFVGTSQVDVVLGILKSRSICQEYLHTIL